MIGADLLESLLINPKRGSKNHFICDCLFCGKSRHMYVNKLTGLWDCKSCGEKGNIITFLIKLDKLSLLEGEDVNIDLPLQLSLKCKQEQKTEFDIKIESIKLPIGFKHIVFGDKYYNYLLGRKFSEIDFLLYTPGYTMLKRKYLDYVILPVARDFEIKAFIARYTGDDLGKKRYLNSSHEFNKLLFGYDELHKETRTVILVEGVFDKIGVTTELNLHYNNEMKCLATFGKKLSNIQLYLLQIANIENLIFMYDGRDAVDDMKKIVSEISKQFKNIWLTYTGVLDPAESDRNQILQYLSNAEKPNQFWISKVNKLKLKK